MPFRIGDLVAEDHSLYWKFYHKSFIFINEESDPSEGEAKQTIGIVMSVHKRFPDAFFDIPYYVYKVKWLNAPAGNYWDDKYFYEDELVLLSRVNPDEPDPEYEEDIDFAEYDEEKEEE